MTDTQKVKERAWACIEDLHKNKRPLDDIRTEGLFLNNILKAEQLEIQKLIVENNLVQSKLRRARALEEGENND